MASFGREQTTYSAMGRFGNHTLVNGETELDLSARQGEVVRFYFHEHRQHEGVQRGGAQRADEARRR